MRQTGCLTLAGSLVASGSGSSTLTVLGGILSGLSGLGTGGGLVLGGLRVLLHWRGLDPSGN